MRTTVRLDDALLADAKRYAAEHGTTLTNVIEESLRERLARSRESPAGERVALPTFRGDGVRPGVDIHSGSALRELMDEGAPIEKRR
jgi:hypothetical protein